jgi:thiol-disulfide isomerase/thioredoxin
MRNALIMLVAVAAVIAVVGIFGSYLGQNGPGLRAGSGPATLAGAPAVSYPIKRLDGTTDAVDRYRGKVVVLNLWATWCAPCRDETPALERLYKEERSRGLVVLGVDQGESASKAAAFANEFGLHYPVLVDEEQLYGRAYSSIGLPTTVIIDRQGRIVRGIDGAMTLAQMREAVAPALRTQ